MIAESGGAIRNALRTTARGFLLGVGFSVALLCVYALAWHWMETKTRASMGDIAENASTKEIVLADVEELRHDGMTSIVGSAKNTGKSPVGGVEIQADLFEHGKFVDQHSTYISGKIAPGESKHFKISCGCRDSPAAEHDSYKVEVVSKY